MLTRSQIRNAASSTTYSRGVEIQKYPERFKGYYVQQSQADSRVDVINALVWGSGRNIYEVKCRVNRSAGSIEHFWCECPAFSSYPGPCKHCVAVLLKYTDEQTRIETPQGIGSGVGVGEGNGDERRREVIDRMAAERASGGSSANESGVVSGATTGNPLDTLRTVRRQAHRTSDEVQQILKRQSKKKTAPVLQRDVFGKVRIQPILSCDRGEVTAEFKVGVDHMYVMKNVFEFVKNVIEENQFAYGKKLDFFHTMNAFDRDSQPLVKFLIQWAMMNYQGFELRDIYYRPSYPKILEYLQTMRRIPLKSRDMEIFLDAIEGKPFEMSIVSPRPYRAGKTGWEISRPISGWWQECGETLTRVILITGKEDGITIKYAADQVMPTLTMTGESSYMVFLDGKVYRIPRRQIREVEELVRFLDDNADRKLFVETADVPGFCREILPILQRIYTIEKEKFDEESFMAAQATFSFYLDAPSPDRVTCKIYAVYGDRKYNVFDQQTDMAGRELMEEVRIRELAGACFCGEPSMPQIMQGEGRVTGMLTLFDDEKIYALLDQGLKNLHELGTVYLSETLRHIEVKTAPKVSVGLSVMGDLLELTMTAGDMDSSELVEILSKYNRKKKYYRLKSGDFVRVEDDSIQALADLGEALDLTPKQLTGGAVKVPKFRALYLDQALREKEAMSVERNRDFRALIRNMKTVEESDYEVPSSLNPILREYQKTGFRWLKTLSKSGFGGILADDMGLGKTLQVITYLLSEQEEAAAVAPVALAELASVTSAPAAGEPASGFASAPAAGEPVSGFAAAPAAGEPVSGFAEAAGSCDRAPSLIICPASLVYNWENEIKTFAPALKTRLIVGTAAQRRHQISEICPGEICITSYELLRRDVEAYEKVDFACQVLDEAQYIKNHSTKAARSVKLVRAAFRIALTGTPVENRLSELWSIFDYLMPGFLYRYDRFRSELEQPITMEQDEDAIRRLQMMIRPFVLRRLKGDVLKDLPDKIEKNMLTRLEGEQQQLYDAHVKQLQLFLDGTSDAELKTSKIQILSMLTRLRQICCDPALAFEDYRGGASKADLCMELVQNGVDGGHQILLFSQFTTMLEELKRRLDTLEIPYFILTGATPKETRIELVRRFNAGEVPVFLISLKAGGTGLNLTAADMVIHFDPWWNLAVQNQATDRAHRIGQKKVVNVYKLIAQGTIEENIIKLQEKKKALADQILGGDGIESGSFSREELLQLLG